MQDWELIVPYSPPVFSRHLHLVAWCPMSWTPRFPVFCPVFSHFRLEGDLFPIIPSSPKVQISNNKHLVRSGLTVGLGFIFFKKQLLQLIFLYICPWKVSPIFVEDKLLDQKIGYFNRYCQVGFPVQTSVYLERRRIFRELMHLCPGLQLLHQVGIH